MFLLLMFVLFFSVSSLIMCHYLFYVGWGIVWINKRAYQGFGWGSSWWGCCKLSFSHLYLLGDNKDTSLNAYCFSPNTCLFLVTVLFLAISLLIFFFFFYSICYFKLNLHNMVVFLWKCFWNFNFFNHFLPSAWWWGFQRRAEFCCTSYPDAV